MKLYFFLSQILFLVCINIDFLHAEAAISAQQEENQKKEQSKEDSLSFQPVSFSAKYKISLDKSSYFDEGIDEVNGVNGTLEMTVEEKGDVWTTQQKSTLYIYYKGKAVADKYDLIIASYESKNGQSYEFYVRSIVNGKQDEMIYKGEGKLPEGQQGYVQLKSNEITSEESKLVVLPKSTLFPLRHLYMLVTEALKGNMTVGQRKVFDGSSDAQEVVEVDAYITPKNNYKMNINTDAKTEDAAATELANRLKNAKAWQIKMNVFALGSRDDSEPDYTYTQTVNSLGIPVSMKITHSDPEFTVNIVMTDFGKTASSIGAANISTVPSIDSVASAA
ncbi:MAG: DUF1849 family protein [Pseudomonadota bacterium]